MFNKKYLILALVVVLIIVASLLSHYAFERPTTIVYFSTTYPSYRVTYTTERELSEIVATKTKATWMINSAPIAYDNWYGTPTTFRILVYNGDPKTSELRFGTQGPGSQFLTVNYPVTLVPGQFYLTTFTFKMPKEELPTYEKLTFKIYFDVYQDDLLLYRMVQ